MNLEDFGGKMGCWNFSSNHRKNSSSRRLGQLLSAWRGLLARRPGQAAIRRPAPGGPEQAWRPVPAGLGLARWARGPFFGRFLVDCVLRIFVDFLARRKLVTPIGRVRGYFG